GGLTRRFIHVSHGVPGTDSPPRDVASMLDAFTTHLRDAIALNRDRAATYARDSDGRSAALSRRLIRAERAILPLAGWLDRRGDLGAAFVAIADLPDPATPPRWTSGGSLAASGAVA